MAWNLTRPWLTRDSREAKLTALEWCQQILPGTQNAANAGCQGTTTTCIEECVKTEVVFNRCAEEMGDVLISPMQIANTPGQDTAIGLSTGYQYMQGGQIHCH